METRIARNQERRDAVFRSHSPCAIGMMGLRRSIENRAPRDAPQELGEAASTLPTRLTERSGVSMERSAGCPGSVTPSRTQTCAPRSPLEATRGSLGLTRLCAEPIRPGWKALLLRAMDLR